MINEFCGMNEVLLETLIDGYNATSWDITWKEFLIQAQTEIDIYLQELMEENEEEE